MSHCRRPIPSPSHSRKLRGILWRGRGRNYRRLCGRFPLMFQGPNFSVQGFDAIIKPLPDARTHSPFRSVPKQGFPHQTQAIDRRVLLLKPADAPVEQAHGVLLAQAGLGHFPRAECREPVGISFHHPGKKVDYPRWAST